MPRVLHVKHSETPAIVDVRDYVRLAQFRWYCTKRGYAYTVDERGHYRWLHLEVLPAPKGFTTDHRNRNRLDNRRANLRLITRHQQQHNQGPRRNNTTGFKGVTRDGGRWKAQIMAYGVTHNLGRFDNPADAALAYDLAARRLHGRYAYQNFRRAG